MALPALKRVSKQEAKRLRDALRPFQEAKAYLTANLDSLLDDYEDEYVAVDSDGVVAHSRTRAGLSRMLSNVPEERLGSLYTAFLTKKRRTLIL